MRVMGSTLSHYSGVAEAVWTGWELPGRLSQVSRGALVGRQLHGGVHRRIARQHTSARRLPLIGAPHPAALGSHHLVVITW